LKVFYACSLAGRRAAGAVHEDLSWISADTTGEHGAASGLQDKEKDICLFLNNHHGDGIVGVWCKVLPGDNVALIKADPKRFYMPAYVGPRGGWGFGWMARELTSDELVAVEDRIEGNDELMHPVLSLAK
jgi:hypothetical protein